MQSILQTEKVCYKTGSTDNLHKHHIYGGANRKISEQNGFWIWLRADWHNMADYGIHFNKTFMQEIQAECQRVYEQTHTRNEFMKLIGRNYL